MKEKEKILLVGGSGTIGKRIAEKLSEDYEIVIFDRNKRTDFNTVQFNVLDSLRFKEEFKKYKFKAAIHLTGSKNISHAENNLQEAFELNVTSLRNLVDSCEETNTKIIFISSASIYGNQEIPNSEKDVPKPINIYGILKYLAEEVLINNCEEKGMKYTILRVFSVYNPEDKNDEKILIGKLFNAINTDKILDLFNINQIRDYINIKDLEKIILKVISNPETDNKIINAGSGIKHTILEIVNLFKGKGIKFNLKEGNIAYDSLADITLLKDLCDLVPEDVIKDIKEKIENE